MDDNSRKREINKNRESINDRINIIINDLINFAGGEADIAILPETKIKKYSF